MNSGFIRRPSFAVVALALFTGFLALSAATSSLQAAAFTPIPQPDAAYTSSTTMLPITGNDFDTTLALSDANLTLTFSALMQEFTAPTTWTDWGAPPATEGTMPRVLSPFDFMNVFSVNMIFSQGLTTFGLEAEPDTVSQGPFPMKLDFFNGATLLGTVSYSAVEATGAVLFAANSMTPITSATLTVEGNSNLPAGTDFGAARFRYALAGPASVPEGGSSFALMLMALLSLATLHRWQLRTKQV